MNGEGSSTREMRTWKPWMEVGSMCHGQLRSGQVTVNVACGVSSRGDNFSAVVLGRGQIRGLRSEWEKK